MRVSPKVARKQRMKCASEMFAIFASAATLRGSANDLSIASLARSRLRFRASTARVTVASLRQAGNASQHP